MPRTTLTRAHRARSGRTVLLAAVAIAIGACALGAPPAARAADEDIRTLDRRFREVAAKAIPATVLVKSTLADGSGRSGFGSGATISADGYILTCSHVVEMAGQVEVAFPDGESFPARVLSKNPRQDYALLKVEREGLPHFPLGDSRALRLGQWVVALGHPGGPYPDLRPAFSVGRVTGLHRRLPVQMMERNYDDAIRTDAPIFAGNSGGPLVTLEGDLVGLNGAILLINEHSYAVPVHEIIPNLAAMKRGEDVPGRAGSGGFGPIEEFEGKDLAKFLGRAGRRLLGREGIGKLIPGSGPERDDLARALERLGKSLEGERAQDLLGSLFDAFGGKGGGEGERRGGGEPPGVPDLERLQRQLEELFGGGGGGGGGGPDPVDPADGLKDLLDRLARGFGFGDGRGEGGDDRARPGGGSGERGGAPPAAAGRPRVRLGIVLQPDDEAIVGVAIAEVAPASPAATAGLRAGDLLVRLGGRRISGGDDVGRALAGRAPGERVEALVLRSRLLGGALIHEEVRLEVTLAAREGESE
jgi:S1-C subfamily serine protease